MPATEVGLIEVPRSFEVGGAGAGLPTSPACSTSVLRFKVPGGGGCIPVGLALFTEVDNSESLRGEGTRVGGRIWDTNCLQVTIEKT